MKDSTRQSKQKSSEKEKHDGKNFRIPISNGIFEHYARLKDARWLLDLFIDWTTQEVPAPDGSRDGLVLGGKPIRDEDTARAFGCTKRTTRRWRLRLAQFAYISQERRSEERRVGKACRSGGSPDYEQRPRASCVASDLSVY